MLTQPSPSPAAFPGASEPSLPFSLPGKPRGKSFLSSAACFTSSAERPCSWCALMSNVRETELSFHVTRQDKLLGACRNPILGAQAKPHKVFTSSHWDLLLKALKSFAQSLCPLCPGFDGCLFEILCCSQFLSLVRRCGCQGLGQQQSQGPPNTAPQRVPGT